MEDILIQAPCNDPARSVIARSDPIASVARGLDRELAAGQGRSYRRIIRIDCTGLPSYSGPNMCIYSPNNKALISKKRPGGILIQDPLRTSYTSAGGAVFLKPLI
ncbi:hypothetical protein TNCV_3861521 [Trichonephila clavipes]|nr:hypothetical protein TNCV_3861521 [Trichonephila clavipes]